MATLRTFAYIMVLGVIHFCAGRFFNETESGRRFRDYLRNWKTDSLLHLILCGFTVITFLWAGILLVVIVLEA